MVTQLLPKIKKYFIFLLFLAFTFCLSGCGCSKKEKKYYIGIDPSFYPLGLGQVEKNTYGFTRELLLELAEELNVRFYVVKANWDNLFYGLEKIKYRGVMSSKYPYNFSIDKYNFSNVFLQTGPALILKKGSVSKSLEDLGGKLVGYIRGDESILSLEKYPNILVKAYDSIPSLLEDLNKGFLDGALADIVKGNNFVNNLYFNTLEVKLPLTTQGLRLITLKDDEEMVRLFNTGLEKLEKKNVITKLKRKWGLF